MRHFDRKSLGIGLALMALFTCISSSGYAYQISVYPDSVLMTAAVGTSSDAYVFISDGRDTTQPNLTPGSVSVTLEASAGSGFTMLTDSVLHFVGVTVVHIRYSPMSNNNSTGELLIQSDSTTAYVALVGTVTRFTPQLQVQLGNYDSLVWNQKSCQNFSVYNPNPDAITITQISVTDNANGTQWSIENEVSLPVSVSSHSSLTLGELCALLSTDSSDIYGNLEIDYTYDSSSYNGGASLSGYGAPISSTCVTADGVVSDAISEGQSSTGWFDLTNNSDTSVTIDSAEIVGTDYSEFSIASPTFPITLASRASQKVNITCTMPSPAAKNDYYASFVANVEGTSSSGLACSSVSVPLHEELYLIDADSTTLDVPPGTNTLSIVAHATKSRHAIFIHNAGTNNLLLQSLTISAGDSMAFFGTEGQETTDIYDSLGVGATSQSIELTLNAPDTGAYDIDLTLAYQVEQASRKGTTPQGSLTYTIVAHRLPPASAGVSEPNMPAPIAFTLSPNPAQGVVTIGLPDGTASNVEIYDVLGNLVFQGIEHGSFIWDGALRESPIANGTYIVRVSQGGLTSSERLMIAR